MPRTKIKRLYLIPNLSKALAETCSGSSALIGSISHQAESYGPRLIQLGIALLRGYAVPPYNYVHHRAVTPEMLGAEGKAQNASTKKTRRPRRWTSRFESASLQFPNFLYGRRSSVFCEEWLDHRFIVKGFDWEIATECRRR